MICCRVHPLVLDLCMLLPRAVRSVTLTAQFTKSFLRMLEHPPDAHRGFDIPAVIITVGHAIPGSPTISNFVRSGHNVTVQHLGSCNCTTTATTGTWQTVVAEKLHNPDVLLNASPLMLQLGQQRPQMVSTGFRRGGVACDACKMFVSISYVCITWQHRRLAIKPILSQV